MWRFHNLTHDGYFATTTFVIGIVIVVFDYATTILINLLNFRRKFEKHRPVTVKIRHFLEAFLPFIAGFEIPENGSSLLGHSPPD